MSKKFGILAVTFDRGDNVFNREWVTDGDGRTLYFDDMITAGIEAEKLEQHGLEAGENDIGYRAKVIL